MKWGAAVVVAMVCAAALCCGRPVAPTGEANVEAAMARVEAVMREEFGVTGPAEAYATELIRHDVPMRDGVTLSTRVWVPRRWDGTEKLSCVLDRTPYGAFYTAMSLLWVIDGYCIIMQDVRGTGGSGGRFEVWRYDGVDAYDTIEWAVEQPWSNGAVFAWGVSADANSVYAQLESVSPHLKAHFPVFGVADGYHLIYPQGAYREGLADGWLRSVCTECIDEVRSHEFYSDWWAPLNQTGHFDRVSFGSVHWAGQWDIFVDGQVDAFNGYHTEGSGDAYLFIDPHGHCYSQGRYNGISLLGFRLGRETFRRAHAAASSPDGAVAKEPLLPGIEPITFFVQGPVGLTPSPLVIGNYYTTMSSWPVVNATSLYLTPDGALAPNPPTANTNVTFVYDPSDPVPTLGGHNLFGTCGSEDQSELEDRDDVLVFTGEPLPSPLAITGKSMVSLLVSSSAVDTDFSVKLTDVDENGKSFLVTEGIVRMRLRDSTTEFHFLRPGDMYPVEIEMWFTSYIFQRNHRVRLTVSSSNDPRWSSNRNNGLSLADQDTAPPVVAHNTLHFSPSANAHVHLPVVNIADLPDNVPRRPREE